MKKSSNQNYVRLFLFVVLSLTSVIFLTGATLYFTVKPESLPTTSPDPNPENPLISAALASGANATQGRSPMAANQIFAPFLDIVPDVDGADLFISAGAAEIEGPVEVVANISIGGGNKRGRTMTYSDTVQAYVTTATGFTPGQNEDGTLSITTTLGLDTGLVEFNRVYIPDDTAPIINAPDGLLQLTGSSTDTLPAEAYVAVAPSYAPPAPPPPGHRLIGSSYSVRASGALVKSDQPMSLNLFYNEDTLAGADPHTLTIFAWNASAKQWERLAGTLFADFQYINTTTDRFTTYALMTTTMWRDDFLDETGLSDQNNTDVDLSQHLLKLADVFTSGWAISTPITPAVAFETWDRLTFTQTVTPPTTTLTVDVLTADDVPVMTGLSSGDVDLSHLDAAGYPVLKLRANLTSTIPGESPALNEWRLRWTAAKSKIYLPVVMK